jgi:hypothetical protein
MKPHNLVGFTMVWKTGPLPKKFDWRLDLSSGFALSLLYTTWRTTTEMSTLSRIETKRQQAMLKTITQPKSLLRSPRVLARAQAIFLVVKAYKIDPS